MDMDNLKMLNKKSQKVANQVIKQVGGILEDYAKNDGITAYRPHQGGDEFIMILCDKRELVIAEEIRKFIEHIGSTTISVGVSVRRSNEIGISWYKRANDALERAKGDGKNRVAVAPK